MYLAAVIGAGDSKDVMKIEKFLKGEISIMINSQNKFTCLAVNDAVNAIVNATKKNNIGEKYLVGKYRLTTREYFKTISKISNAPMPKKFIGKNLTLYLAYLMTWWANIRKKPPLMSIDLIKTQLERNLIFDGSKAERELSLTYSPIEDAIKDEINYIKRKGVKDYD